MSTKKEQKKMEDEKLSEFLNEVKNIKTEESSKSQSLTKEVQRTEFKRLAYQCPNCHKLIESRKEPCKHCGYKGYIPISEEQTKKIRFVLFIVILVVAIVVYILTRQ